MATNAKPPADTRTGDFAVADLLSRVASRTPTPGGGAVAGLAVALAGSLAGMVARYSVDGETTGGIGAETAAVSDSLMQRALDLADLDRVAYQRYLDARRLPSTAGEEVRQEALHAASDAAADVPAELASVAADIAGIAEQLARHGNHRLRPDACTAACLSAAAATSAAVLVHDNVESDPDDPRVRQAIDRARAAHAHARSALALAGLADVAEPLQLRGDTP